MATSARRELAAAVGGSALAGALALVAGGQPWAETTVVRRQPLPPVVELVSGADAAPLVPAAGLVLLAAAVALLAVRSASRVVVGLLMAVAGGVLGWSGIRALTGGLVTGDATVNVSAAWPVLAAVAGVVAVVAGLVVVLRGRGWPGMGRRYERAPQQAAPTRPVTDEDRAQETWKALDRGEDPTA
ncbi:Trp biosynthesis-associated membrane protein [Blastococcus brunescens]|uniref:Trp biosynthesis-associated membrane protein n=1 Tax=Blastococcus brunescens TaxID=1564165 RepID=A0ABZ1B9T9_9ACTN|nr:Trp biosynthesis-associated membrane protein [Blastococcus sp. BMG 8361]WRL66951.1 Trp biosynthesis-associated membrane protein [Blastococcus sp. BMG 8361]